MAGSGGGRGWGGRGAGILVRLAKQGDVHSFRSLIPGGGGCTFGSLMSPRFDVFGHVLGMQKL